MCKVFIFLGIISFLGYVHLSRILYFNGWKIYRPLFRIKFSKTRGCPILMKKRFSLQVFSMYNFYNKILLNYFRSYCIAPAYVLRIWRIHRLLIVLFWLNYIRDILLYILLFHFDSITIYYSVLLFFIRSFMLIFNHKHLKWTKIINGPQKTTLIFYFNHRIFF